MVNAPKTLTTSLGCLGALLTVVMASIANRQMRYYGEGMATAVFSPDGNTLYGAGSIHTPQESKSTLQAWDTRTGKLLWRHLQEGSTSNHISLSHDGKTLLLPNNYIPHLYDARTGQRISHSLSEAPHITPYCPALFTKDDEEIIAVLADGSTPVVLDATTGKLKRKLRVAPDRSIFNIALSPNGKQLVFLQNNQLILRDLTTDKTLAKQTVEQAYFTITPFDFLPDGKRFQCGEKIWTPGMSKLTTPPDTAQHDADSLDGKRFVTLERRSGKNKRYPLGTIEDIWGKRVTLEGKTGW